jgi:hypothetical protein
MSSVRMCDQCGNVFSENSDDWTTFSGTQLKRDANGRRVVVTVSQDACAECSNRTFQNQGQKVLEAGEE